MLSGSEKLAKVRLDPKKIPESFSAIQEALHLHRLGAQDPRVLLKPTAESKEPIEGELYFDGSSLKIGVKVGDRVTFKTVWTA